MIQFSNIASTYNEYLDTLYSYALHLGFDEQTAMDAIHDVFYKFCTQHSSLNEIHNLKSYLFRSLRNRLIDMKRTNREDTALLSTQDETQEVLPFQLHVNRLTDRQREIVYLRYIREQSYEEIAEIMQISVAACRNLISKSITRLKDSTLPIILFFLFVR